MYSAAAGPAITSRVSGSASNSQNSCEWAVSEGGVVRLVHASWLALHKTDWTNFDAKFLVCAANIHRGKIYDG